MVSPDELIYFIELAQILNFSRASERIGISQPSLSVAIKRLEKAIGTDLFIRRKKGVTLTPAGKRLLSHAKQLLQSWESVKSAALASHYAVQGSISIGCHPSIALFSLPKFLPELLATYPKLEVRLKHDLSRKILENVIDLSVDVGIVVNPIKHPDLVLQKLFDDKVTFWHSTDTQHPHQNLHSGEALIICDPELLQTQWLLKRINKLGIKYQRIISSSSLEVIASLTAHGCGVGILPKSVFQSANKLKKVASSPVYSDEIYLAYRHENREIKAIQEIIRAIKAAYQK